MKRNTILLSNWILVPSNAEHGIVVILWEHRHREESPHIVYLIAVKKRLQLGSAWISEISADESIVQRPNCFEEILRPALQSQSVHVYYDKDDEKSHRKHLSPTVDVRV